MDFFAYIYYQKEGNRLILSCGSYTVVHSIKAANIGESFDFRGRHIIKTQHGRKQKLAELMYKRSLISILKPVTFFHISIKFYLTSANVIKGN